MLNEPIDRFDSFEDWGIKPRKLRIPKKESIKKPKPDEKGDVRVPFITQLREDLAPLSEKLTQLTPDQRKEQIEKLVTWIQIGMDHGPQLDPTNDLNDQKFPHAHTLSGIKVTFENSDDGKDTHKRIQRIYAALDRHIQTWKKLKKTDPSFDLHTSVKTALSPLYIHKQHVTKKDIDSAGLTPNRYSDATWMRDNKIHYNQNELHAFHYLIQRRVRFLEHTKQQFNPNSILYVESESDQLPSKIFGQEYMTNYNENTSDNAKWHMGESHITSEDLTSTNTDQQFDVIYFSKFDQNMAKNIFERSTKKLAPGGIIIFDIQNQNLNEWIATQYHIAEATAAQFEAVQVSAEFGDIQDDTLSQKIAEESSSVMFRTPINIQQCFRMFSKSAA